MKLLQLRRRAITYAAMAIAFAGASAQADVIAVSTAAFPGPGTTLITFTGLGSVEVNGLVVGGVQFSYSLGNNQLIIDGGPSTPNVTSPNIVNIGDATGTLTLLLPSLQSLFGFGFSVLTASPVAPLANATTITLFNNATNVGALSYNGVPDPTFAGGFAGISSTLAFNRVLVSFNPAVTDFAVDNIQFANVISSPEPATLALVFTGLVGIGFLRRRRPATSA